MHFPNLFSGIQNGGRCCDSSYLKQRACTTAAATQTMIIAPVLAAATYAATASVPVIEYITPDPVVYTAPAPVNEYVASAHVSEYVAPSLVTEHETPAVFAPVVQIVQFPQVQDPQSKICEKNVETVAFLSGQDTLSEFGNCSRSPCELRKHAGSGGVRATSPRRIGFLLRSGCPSIRWSTSWW